MDLRGVFPHASTRDRPALQLGQGRGEWNQSAWFALRLALATLAVALIGGSILVIRYAEHTYGRYVGIPERPARVAFVDLAANRAARGDAPPPGLARWRGAAERSGFELEVLVVADLYALDVDRYCSVVLPEQERISDEEWSGVRSLAREGLGIILTGAAGSRDGAGERRSAPLIEALIPGRLLSLQAPTPGALRVSQRGPLVAGFQPGALLEVHAPAGAYAVAAPGAVTWGAEGGPRPPGAAALFTSVLEGAPVVWISVGASAFADVLQGERLLGNALRFAAREPLAELRAWPGGTGVAALFAVADSELSGLIAAGFREPQLPALDESIRDPALLLGRLLAEFARVESEGGLYALAAGIPGLERPDRSDVEDGLLSELDPQRVWVAQGTEAAEWWQRRRGVVLELARPGSGRAEVRLHNGGDHAVRGATARVYLPVGARVPTRLRGGGLFARPLLRVASDRSWVDVIVPELDPGESVRYSFVY
jgi:hypothetical protein